MEAALAAPEVEIHGGGLAPPEVKFVEVGTGGTLGDGTPRCGLTGSGSPPVT